MKAFFLHKPDGTPTEISACGICGRVAGKGCLDASEKCCTCLTCGKPLTEEERKVRRLYHLDCERQNYALRQEARLEKAELVIDYNDPVYFEGATGSLGDGYFEDVGELAEHLDDSWDEVSGPRPEFAFCCTSQSIFLDPDNILENATEEAYDDAYSDLNCVDEFRAAVITFNEANKSLLTWNVDQKHKVAIPPADSHYIKVVKRGASGLMEEI